jgi:chromosome segregation ATPase
LLQEKILREKIQGYENENNELDSHINQSCDELAEIELSIKKAQDELVDLQKAIAELGMLNEKYKT